MKSTLFITAILLLMLFPCVGQDIISTKSSGEIKAKVLEINDETIKYKKYDYQDGPTFTLQKSEIIKITYQNGSVDEFSAKTTTAQSNPSTVPGTVRIEQPVQKQGDYNKPKEKKFPELKRFFITAGVSLPFGKCAKMDEGLIAPLWEDVNDYGGATVGFNIGIKGQIPVAKCIGITIGGDFIYNGIDEDAYIEDEKYMAEMSQYANDELGTLAYDYRLDKCSKYINVPIMVGVNYTHLFDKGLGLSAGISLGADFDFITSTVYRNTFGNTFTNSEYDSYTRTRTDYYSAEKIKYVYVPAVHFAYSANVAFIFGKRWSLSLEYLGTTKKKIKYDWKETSKEYKVQGNSEIRMNVSKLGFNMFMIKIGVGF